MNDKKRNDRLIIPKGRLRLIIDTDAKNEVDDQFALAWALMDEERFIVEAVYAAPFAHDCQKHISESDEIKEKANSLIGYADNPADGMRQSYEEIVRVFNLLDKDYRGKVFYGSETYIKNHEPVISEAAKDLVERVNRSEDVIYIAAIGAITNIASAILLDPGIVNKIVVIWLAGQPLEFGHGIEFNMMQDIEASQIILNSGVPLILIPCMNVAALLSASAEELKKNLEGKNPICDYLYRIVKKDFADMEAEAAMVKMDRSGYLRGREDRDEEYMSQFKSDPVSYTHLTLPTT